MEEFSKYLLMKFVIEILDLRTTLKSRTKVILFLLTQAPGGVGTRIRFLKISCHPAPDFGAFVAIGCLVLPVFLSSLVFIVVWLFACPAFGKENETLKYKTSSTKRNNRRNKKKQYTMKATVGDDTNRQTDEETQ